MENFAEKLETFVAGVNKMLDEKINATMPPTLGRYAVAAEKGRKYVKIVKTIGGGQRSVYAFIDTTNGNVLYPASWSAPAKHARGNIFNPDNGLGCCGPYGVATLR